MKHFWLYIKSKPQNNIGIGILKNQSGSIVTDPSENAENLNNQFKSVFTIEDTTSIPDKGISPYTSDHKYQYYKSPGPDNMHAAFLKHVAAEIATLLPHLFHQSIRNGTVPVS